MKSFGQMLKKIRKNRHYTQEELTDGIISRDTISRIERFDQHTSFETGIQLLERMGVSLTDFDNFMINEHSDDFSELINLFLYCYRGPGDVKKLEKIYKMGSDIYKKEKIRMAKDIMIVADVMLLMDENFLDPEKLQEIQLKLEPVWSSISEVDEWSMVDIKILNSIFFIFDLEVAEKVVYRACRILDNKYPSLNSLKASFLTNYTYLLIFYGHYSEALELNKSARTQSVENGRYDLVIVSDIRKIYLEQEQDWENSLDQQLNLLSVLGSPRLAESFKKESNSVVEALRKKNK